MATLEQKVSLIQAYKADFPMFAADCLKIRTKDGKPAEPLVLNDAQEYIHLRLEKQLAETGRIRAIVLKGRQQGACLAPTTRVLTADLRWVEIGSLRTGDELVATDEETGTLPSGRHWKGRKMRTATVEAVVSTRLPAYRITLDDGQTLVCSGGHRWLVRNSQTQWSWRSIDGPRAIRVGWKLRRVADVWGPSTFDDAWFGGMIDGEGHFERRKTTGGLRLAVSQVAGAVLDRMLTHCADSGYGAYVVSDDGPRKTRLGQRPVHAVCMSRASTMFRLMGVSRPTRFIGARWWDGMSMPDDGEREIVSIEPIAEMDLVDIQTSTGTFLAEGIVSHNSTYIEARFYWRTALFPGNQAVVIAHEAAASANLFGMAGRYHSHMPDWLRPAATSDNAKELVFGALDGGYKVLTAGAKATGRSTTAQLLHGSEFAYWPNAEDHLSGIGQAVPTMDGTEIILESTGNGVGNPYHRVWMEAVAGRGDYIAIFVPWFWQREYRRPPPADFEATADEADLMSVYGLDLEQVAWRRLKIASDFLGDRGRFEAEYPNTPDDAFQVTGKDTVVAAADVAAARKMVFPAETAGPLLLGVDPARFGDDRTALAWRRGRAVTRVLTKSKLDTMQVAGLVARMIKETKPDRVYVDVIGIGAGVFDRLIEMGFVHLVVAVNVAERAEDPERFRNRRSETWWRIREWAADRPASLPDHDAVSQDLLAPGFKYDSAGRVVVDSKEDIKKTGPSPDIADAIGLTFAENLPIDFRAEVVTSTGTPHQMADAVGY